MIKKNQIKNLLFHGPKWLSESLTLRICFPKMLLGEKTVLREKVGMFFKNNPRKSSLTATFSEQKDCVSINLLRLVYGFFSKLNKPRLDLAQRRFIVFLKDSDEVRSANHRSVESDVFYTPGCVKPTIKENVRSKKIVQMELLILNP